MVVVVVKVTVVMTVGRKWQTMMNMLTRVRTPLTLSMVKICMGVREHGHWVVVGNDPTCSFVRHVMRVIVSM